MSTNCYFGLLVQKQKHVKNSKKTKAKALKYLNAPMMGQFRKLKAHRRKKPKKPKKNQKNAEKLLKGNFVIDQTNV